MRRALAALALAAALPIGCVDDLPCRDGTVLVSFTLDAVTAPADTLSLQIAIGGGAPVVRPVPRPPGDATSGTIEIDFPSGYPFGQTITVVVIASQAGVALGARSATLTLDDTCKRLDFALGAGDGGP